RAPGNPPRALRALRPAGGRAEPPVTRDAVGGVSLEVDPLSAASAAPRETSSVLPPIDPALAPPRPGPGKRLVRVLVLIVSGGLFTRGRWMAALRNVAHLLAEVGPLAILAVVPYGVAVTLDTAGWAAILRGLEARVATWRLLGLRLSTEAVHLSFPGGP